MGWERKRGKLHELNRLLRGATDTSFLPTGTAAPDGVRYVITLDADTRLPRGAVERLVGTMAHPLNRPRMDPDRRRVVEGYAVLQPRVTPPLPGREGSWFQRLSSGPAGIDPYAAAVSDVYQDLWGEGSYTGKGIYDVDAFEAALAGRVPENTLLSHDLFEGVFARAGLVTDVELFESAPSHYGVSAARQHRWARGDWQLLPWILGSRIPLIGRWKMVDNLRRTLSAPATFLTLAVGWMLPGTSPAVWSAFVLVTVAVPALLPVLGGVIPRRRGISKRSHARAVGRDAILAASHDGAHVHDAGVPGLADGRRDRADARPRLRDAPPAPGMDDGGPGQGRAPPRSSGLLPPHGRRRRARRRRRPRQWSWGRPHAWPAALPFLATVDRGARDGALDQPAAEHGAHPDALADGDGRAAADRAGGRGGSSRRSSAPRTTPCRPTTSRRRRARSSPTARHPRTSACTCSPRWPPTTSAGSAPSTPSSGWRPPWRRCGDSSASAATSTTGTTRGAASRSNRSTSRRSTAATSPAISSRWPTPPRRWPPTRADRARRSPGSPTWRALVRLASLAAAADVRPRPAAHVRLGKALDARHGRGAGTAARSGRVGRPALGARGPGADGARAGGRPRGRQTRRTAAAEVHAWAEALVETVASHARDLDLPDTIERGASASSRPRHGRWSAAWTSASCSTRCESCSRSATASATACSTPVDTTCSPRRPAWPASWRSPRATSPSRTGSGWAGRSRRSASTPCSCPGRGRCSST